MQRGFIPAQNEEEQQLCRRIEDLAHTVSQHGVPRQTMFLSDREQALAQSVLHRAAPVSAVFDGGHADAERRVLCLAPTQEELPPPAVICLQICTQYAGAPLTHRDYLGALLGLSIKRGCIGDILCADEKTAYAFVADSVCKLIETELVEVGRSKVSVAPAEQDNIRLPQQQNEEKSATVSSLRADAVLAAMLQCNRALAAQYITKQMVQINHVITTSAHADVYAGDIFTVRGKGKMRVCSIGGKSKKDRTFFTYTVY